MVDSIGIALGGLTAQTRRLEASASNVANVRSTGTVPSTDATTDGKRTAYQPLTVAQTNANPGTRATFTPITPPYLQEYAPDDSAANADGMVAAPNVDLATERVTQMAANRAYGANVAVVRTQDEMLTSLLDSKV
ncbi:flagellar basal body rod protein FlgG [Azospirillum thiophilum]|uniref:Flagellar biosynthesis protein FlgG n=1 Tax=Azospirillum thiophilum TaxID=528244 RepID=A0AAC8ZV66_9PROT|nr:flagellar basal body rod C-terminal domain-containing protein [Azospirillum thiophilum]ALG73298.1 flagellar biosynthesis protein FlgG [Azospirillum thiophilum]KJR63218.1 flagellar basal body rod protein FlgG [Azospirillum thiophilum]